MHPEIYRSHVYCQVSSVSAEFTQKNTICYAFIHIKQALKKHRVKCFTWVQIMETENFTAWLKCNLDSLVSIENH